MGFGAVSDRRRLTDEPDGPLLVDQLRFMAQRFPDELALRRPRRRARRSRSASGTSSRTRLARWLVDHGVAQGRPRRDRTADSDYCLRWIVAYAAIHKAGAVMVPANTRLSTAEMVTILGHAEISAMFTCDELLDHARAVRAEVPSLRRSCAPTARRRRARLGRRDRRRTTRARSRCRSTPTTWPTSCTRRARPGCRRACSSGTATSR